jgi:predicted dehydrogenase
MLNTAILGPGRWAARLVESVQGGNSRLRFVAAGSHDPDRHADFGDRFGMPVTTYDAILADPSIEAVVIATPHTQHRAHAVAAAEAGKHILVEKPLATTKEDAQAIVSACRTAGVKLAHGFNRRFAPAYLEMLRRVHEVEIGELLHVEGQFSGPSGYRLKPGMWRADRTESPAGAMTPRGIHALDSLISMAGPVISVFAYSEHREIAVDVDDVTSALLRFGSGVTGYIAAHHATAEIWRVLATGSKGWMEMRGPADLTVCTLEGEPEKIPLERTDMERAELEAFADFVAGGSYPVSNAQALNGVSVIEAMVASARSGQLVRLH